jgi:hypothetical protein
MTPRTGTLSARPLLDAAALRVLASGRDLPCGADFVGWPAASAQEIARLLGVSQRQVQRMRAGHSLTFAAADRLAVALGLHPGELWPEFAGLVAS